MIHYASIAIHRGIVVIIVILHKTQHCIGGATCGLLTSTRYRPVSVAPDKKKFFQYIIHKLIPDQLLSAVLYIYIYIYIYLFRFLVIYIIMLLM